MQYSLDNNFSQDQKKVPEGLKVKESAGCSTRMENETRRMETPGEPYRGLEENKQILNERGRRESISLYWRNWILQKDGKMKQDTLENH